MMSKKATIVGEADGEGEAVVASEDFGAMIYVLDARYLLIFFLIIEHTIKLIFPL